MPDFPLLYGYFLISQATAYQLADETYSI